MIGKYGIVTTVPEWKRLQCVHCAAGLGMSAEPGYHWDGSANAPKCTALDPEQLVDLIAARGLRVLIEYCTPLRGGPPQWVVRFGEGEIVADPDRRTAIVKAALAEVGALTT